MALCNPKTKDETGFDYVLKCLKLLSPFGSKSQKAVLPFMPGQEAELREDLDRLDQTVRFLKDKKHLVLTIMEILAELKDNSFSIERSKNNALSVVELYEIKTLLMQMEKIVACLHDLEQEGAIVPESFKLTDIKEILDTLDPACERINTFYIYDIFSERLAGLRKERRIVELEIRKVQKADKNRLESKYGIIMTPKYEYFVAKSNKELLEEALGIPELILIHEDYMTASFSLKQGEAMDELKKELEAKNQAIEDEELLVRELLSSKISGFSKEIMDNCYALGELDYNLAKAVFTIEKNCTKPEITTGHIFKLVRGRQLALQDILRGKNKTYSPVSIELARGVTTITGANMGGKTVTLKMVGQCALMVQYGFFLPADRAEIGLSSYIHILVGDSQNLKRGLSSFGSEMEELKDVLDRSKDRALLLIDEIAGGTNPTEGHALTKSLLDYLGDKAYISLITTHFDGVSGHGVKNLQVKGLAGVNFENLSREIRYANRKQRIEIIGKYMDYGLREAGESEHAPKDALNIAAMLGLNPAIIEKAREFMEDRKNEEQAESGS